MKVLLHARFTIVAIATAITTVLQLFMLVACNAVLHGHYCNNTIRLILLHQFNYDQYYSIATTSQQLLCPEVVDCNRFANVNNQTLTI